MKMNKTLEYPVVEIELSKINAGRRYREDYGDLEDLKKSLVGEGQLQNIGVIDRGEFYELAFGGRRFSAMRELGWEKARCLVFPPETTEFQLRVYEHAENIRRKDMTTREKANLVDEIHRLHLIEHGELKGRSGEGWSQKKTADFIKMDEADVSRLLKIAKASKTNQAVANAKTDKEALKLIEKAERDAIKEILAERLEKEQKKGLVEGVKKDLCESYIVGDFLKEGKNIPAECADLLEIDPPYAVNIDNLYRWEDRPGFISDTQDFKEVDPEDYPAFIREVLKQAFRIGKKNSWVIVWCACIWLEETYQAMLEAGFATTRRHGLWIKPGKQGRNSNPDIHLTSDYEPFLYGRKGDIRLQSPGASSLYSHVNKKGDKVHVTEKPISLYEELLSVFVPAGSQIVSPFLGSGNVILAASNLKMRCFGYDLSKNYKNEFVLRVHQEEPGHYGR